MKHLHNYKNFNEKFNLSPTDDPSVTAAKKNYNDLELALQQYKMNATKLENLYTAINRKDNTLLYDDVTLKKEVEKIIGRTEELEEESFFSKYLSLLSIKRDIAKKQKTQSVDDETLKGLKTSQETSDSKEEDPRIAETEERMSLNQSDISELQKKLLKDQKDFNDMMTKKTIEFKNSANLIKSPKNNKIQIGNVVSLKK
jgi:hypothetical protein